MQGLVDGLVGLGISNVPVIASVERTRLCVLRWIDRYSRACSMLLYPMRR